MAKMIITHGVVDVNSWLSFKSERAEAISAMGATQVVDYVAQDGSNAAAIAADVDDVVSVLAAVGSPPPELMDAMQRHGVIPPMTIYIEG